MEREVLDTLAQLPPRTGDSVYHRPSGETWVVAYADPSSKELAPCGWPITFATIGDCEIVRRATDAEHLKLVHEIWNWEGERGGLDPRARLVRYLHPDKAPPENRSKP